MNKPIRRKNPLNISSTARNVLIGVAAVGLAALAYELFKTPASSAAGTTTSTGPGTSASTGSSTPSPPANFGPGVGPGGKITPGG